MTQPRNLPHSSGLSFQIRVGTNEYARIAAIIDEVEVGHAYVYFLSNDTNQREFAFGEDLYVNESFRNRGVAAWLARESLRIAKERGCYKFLGFSRFGRDRQHARLEGYGLSKWGYEFRVDFD